MKESTSNPSEYRRVLDDLTELIAGARRRALAMVNRELMLLYWQIGAVIVRQQEQAKWGDGVVEQLAADLRAEFPDMKGFSRDNVFRMRQVVAGCLEVDRWLANPDAQTVANIEVTDPNENVGTVSRQMEDAVVWKVGTPSRLLNSDNLSRCVVALSWSHHYTIAGRCDAPAERYFYLRY